MSPTAKINRDANLQLASAYFTLFILEQKSAWDLILYVCFFKIALEERCSRNFGVLIFLLLLYFYVIWINPMFLPSSEDQRDSLSKTSPINTMFFWGKTIFVLW